MEKNTLKSKAVNAVKWSTITEISAKVVSPVTNMILARILVPEAFGVVATVTMIISFADMFTDSGFQKYLVQHEFKDDDQKYKSANVAFWTNLMISIFLWLIIIIFRDKLAKAVGSPNLGNVIAIAGFELPLTSFSSIQMALYRRDFDFKTLFMVRLVSVFIPLAITIPLALSGLSYWALIIGSISIQLSNSVILTIKSKWKPNLFFCFSILSEMLSFSIWSLIEAVSIWFTAWIDAFIIGSALNSYYLGLYKTSTAMVSTLMTLITAPIIPVLFSMLSRLQYDEIQFKKIFFKIQSLVSIMIFPLGVGTYLYSGLATDMLLGSKWIEAKNVIGTWALTSSIMIVFGFFCSEAYRAKGRPKLSLLAQVLHLAVLVPSCIISSKYGFWPLVYARSWIRMQFVLVHLIIMKYEMGFSVRDTFKNVLPSAISSASMGLFGYLLKLLYDGLAWDIFSIALCTLFYFRILTLFPDMHAELAELKRKYLKSGKLDSVSKQERGDDVFKIAVAGTGYVGLVAGVCFAEIGHKVTCVDVDEIKIRKMKKGIAPIYEADLEDLMKKNYAAGRINYSTDYKSVYRDADVIFLGVGTPEKPDGSANLTQIAEAAKQIAENIEHDCLVVVKSTVPVGTNDKVEQFIKDFLANDVKVEVASNPEFLAEGSAVFDTFHAQRIIIGVESKWAEDILKKIYEPMNIPIVAVNRRSAEMIKYASNNFLALKISYMNDIANLCELVGADVQDVSRGMSFDERIGSKFLNAGIGYGGSCFPKDTKALDYLAKQHGYDLKTIKAAIDVNKMQKIKLFNKACERLISFNGLKVAVLGLTFKPGTDDVREGPSIDNVSLLLDQGADIYAYDPMGEYNFKKYYPEGKNNKGKIKYVKNIEEALLKANVCFLFTEWDEIKSIKPEDYKKLMRTPLVFDGRNIYGKKEMKDAGVEYHSVGR